MRQRFDPDGRNGYFAFAIGGEYRDPTDPRGKSNQFDGIKVMGLKKHGYKTGIWSALEWKRLHCLLKGDHAGAVEGRSKCKRKSDNLGIAEFDGQSALTYFQGQFLVYARANPKESGFRTVQVCSGPLDALSPFQLCIFTGVPDASDIYFLHPYVVPGDKWLVRVRGGGTRPERTSVSPHMLNLGAIPAPGLLPRCRCCCCSVVPVRLS